MLAKNIIHLFLAAAERVPSTAALIQDRRIVSYSQLLKEVKQTATFYQKKKIQKGDKVLVFLPMGMNLYRVVLALFYIGACPVFLDEWVSKERLKECCKLVPCDAIVANRKLLFLSFFIPALRTIKTRLHHKSKDGGQAVQPADVQPDDTALITFTTGSTGIPKAADRPHAFLYAQYTALYPLLNNKAGVSFVSLPIVVLINLGLGKTTLLPPHGFSAEKPHGIMQVNRQLMEENVEEIICSPSLLQGLLNDVRHKPGRPDLKYIFTGGGPVFPDMAGDMVSILKHVRSLIVYGSTEAEPISHIDAVALAATTLPTLKEKGLPVGKPDTHVSVALIPYQPMPFAPMSVDAFDALQVATGEAGEIVVTGAHVLKEYINNLPATKAHKIIVDGRTWHRTGDMGRLDASGQLFLLGNAKDVFEYQNRIYFPFADGYLFKVLTGAKQVALLVYNEQLTVVIESNGKIEPVVMEGALQKVALREAVVVYSNSIPTDPRHHTKIDYDALRIQLANNA